MLFSLALIFLAGLSAASICKALYLPRIIGMLLTGLFLGPYLLDLLDPSILGISADLRQLALIIILIKAGLSLNLSDLKEVGRPAVLLSFLPAVFEILGCVLLAPKLLGVSPITTALIGAILGAVSPAVVVPKMVELIEEKRGTDHHIPQLILAGASLDDVFVIVLFSTFLGMAQGSRVSLVKFGEIPISILFGIVFGALVGWLLACFFEFFYAHGHKIRNSTKVILILGISCLLDALEDSLSGILPFSGLLAVMSTTCILQMKSTPIVGQRLAEKFGKLWIAAEVILFVLVGAAVDIRYTMEAGASAIVLILLALVFRSAGVLLSLAKTPLDWKEKLFCVISYLPKATVQAAIGSVPLSMGLPAGKLILSVAVLSILITAPLGSLGMELTSKRLLHQESKDLSQS